MANRQHEPQSRDHSFPKLVSPSTKPPVDLTHANENKNGATCGRQTFGLANQVLKTCSAKVLYPGAACGECGREFAPELYQTQRIPFDFVRCRYPECTVFIHEDALYQACDIHWEIMSDWDFQYCEAEKRDYEQEEDFFPNGQCKDLKVEGEKKILQHCAHHRKYRHRKLFKDSRDAMAGKWFPERKTGSAPFPIGYGTSGGQRS